MTYERHEYCDLVQDTEVVVTLGIEHNSSDDGRWTDYFIDDIRPANGQYLPPISESEKVVLRDAAIHDYLQEVLARQERDY